MEGAVEEVDDAGLLAEADERVVTMRDISRAWFKLTSTPL